MSNDAIEIEYFEGLESLEKLMSKVRRPGDFFMQGRAEVPMPKLEVEGVGLISFPVPEAQARQLIERGELAPYGLGEDTILDTSVRKVWQLPPEVIRLSGKSWANSLQGIVDQAAAGLGCKPNSVAAELYKMLVYDPGAFFSWHRDTEKVDGMFATLVVPFPSVHRGGELVIRHAGREATVDLSAVELSELAFAAFYADCEHEVKPMIEGYRVCLIYNLVHNRKSSETSLTAPLYDAEANAAAKHLAGAFDEPDAPAKIVWLLEHQYSPDGLSFLELKNADAARANVLVEAARQAGCAAHLGIVHIEESGAAEPHYEGGYSYRGRSRWRHYDDDVEEDIGSDSFDVIEVCDRSQYIDQWVNAENRRIDFGPIPLGERELLPKGALDDEKPDHQRCTEATGNEGASFERSYHRAALILWPLNRFDEVLLQAGVGAVLPHLKEKVEHSLPPSADPNARTEAVSLARRVIEKWETRQPRGYFGLTTKVPDRSEMLGILHALGDPDLCERFIGEILTNCYDGSENKALAAAIRLLTPEQAGTVLKDLATANVQWLHAACIDLLSRLLRRHNGQRPPDWTKALLALAEAITTGLPKIESVSKHSLGYTGWERTKIATPLNAEMIADLFVALVELEAETLRQKAAKNIIARPEVFDPGTVLVPALALLRKRRERQAKGDSDFRSLWRHAAEFLLSRGEHPPEKPTDWRQDVKLDCTCADCRALETFARDPNVPIGRFSVRKDRRQHLHGQIERHELDMTHATERKGSPQTLVCTKTRRTYEGKCEQYRADIRSFGELGKALPNPSGDDALFASRMKEAQARANTWEANQ